MAADRSRIISLLQGLAEQERLAHPYDDLAATCRAFDLAEDRQRARACRKRGSQLLILAATLAAVMAVIVASGTRRRDRL